MSITLKEYGKIDPLVCENLCQIRALKLALIYPLCSKSFCEIPNPDWANFSRNERHDGCKLAQSLVRFRCYVN